MPEVWGIDGICSWNILEIQVALNAWCGAAQHCPPKSPGRTCREHLLLAAWARISCELAPGISPSFAIPALSGHKRQPFSSACTCCLFSSRPKILTQRNSHFPCNSHLCAKTRSLKLARIWFLFEISRYQNRWTRFLSWHFFTLSPIRMKHSFLFCVAFYVFFHKLLLV